MWSRRGVKVIIRAAMLVLTQRFPTVGKKAENATFLFCDLHELTEVNYRGLFGCVLSDLHRAVMYILNKRGDRIPPA